MRRTEEFSEAKRVTLRMSEDLWRRLRIEAARRDVSATLLANQLLDEGLSGASPRVDPDWQRRFRSVLETIQQSVPEDLSPEEIEAEITLARAEARAERRARRL